MNDVVTRHEHEDLEARVDRQGRAFEDFRARAESRSAAILLMLTGTLLAAILSAGASLAFYLLGHR